jgi:GDPmannose 4,6-dehydratase
MTQKKLPCLPADALLAELLLSKDYVVHRVKRRSSLINTDR